MKQKAQAQPFSSMACSVAIKYKENVTHNMNETTKTKEN